MIYIYIWQQPYIGINYENNKPKIVCNAGHLSKTTSALKTGASRDRTPGTEELSDLACRLLAKDPDSLSLKTT